MKEEAAPKKDKSDRKAKVKALRAQKLAEKKKEIELKKVAVSAESADESVFDQTDDDDLIERALGNGSDAKDSREKALERLQSRIESLRSGRMGKKTAQEYEEQKRLKRSMKKMKRKENKEKGKLEAAKKRAADSSSNGGSGEPKSKKAKKENTDSAKPVATTENGDLVFSKFDFVIKEGQKKVGLKEKRDKFQGKDYKRLLEKAEKRKERIESVREKNPEKAERIEDNIRWSNAMSRAEGVKVKDDIGLLKKSLKRKEKMKEQKKKKWSHREKQVKADEEKKQQKRETNLQKRRDTVKKAKMNKLRKKGRIA
uniref:SURF6 domain-containing protein n=1 Tax=Steinernema glaseri TaxID=37863 RepID=A0A1I7ZVW7_9BILA